MNKTRQPRSFNDNNSTIRFTNMCLKTYVYTKTSTTMYLRTITSFFALYGTQNKMGFSNLLTPLSPKSGTWKYVKIDGAGQLVTQS